MVQGGDKEEVRGGMIPKFLHREPIFYKVFHSNIF